MLFNVVIMCVFFAVSSYVFKLLSIFEKSHVCLGAPGWIYERWSLRLFKVVKQIILFIASVEYSFYHHANGLGLSIFALMGVIVGVHLRIAAIKSLGQFWSYHIEIKNNHKIIENGIYGLLKHPAYIGNIFMPAFCLLTGAIFTTVIAFIFITWFYIYRSGREEELLSLYANKNSEDLGISVQLQL